MQTTPAFPWYDSFWLTSYVRVCNYLAEHEPGRLAEFRDAFEKLRTRPDFELLQVPALFTADVHQQLRAMVVALELEELERHELLGFGRLIIRNHPLLTVLQNDLTARVSEWVKEAVEPSYNFLSLYNNLGVCRPHLDAPSAKWTVDYCIGQSAPWPIHFTQVRPWPEHWQQAAGVDWTDQIRRDPANRVTTHELHENQALVFGGSSQWHWRERIAQKQHQNFCHLAFFHFLPQGLQPLTEPENWASHFGIPEVAALVIPEVARATRQRTPA